MSGLVLWLAVVFLGCLGVLWLLGGGLGRALHQINRKRDPQKRTEQ